MNTWKIPTALARVFQSESSTPRLYDILKKEIEPDLPGFKPRQMLSLESNGSLHDLIKRSANDLVNEVFYEDVRNSEGFVSPTIVLRPRPLNTPFFDSHFGYPPNAKDLAASKKALNNKIKTLQQLAKESFIEISPAEIKYEDLGRDDHSRFNLYWLRPTSAVSQNFSDEAFVNLEKKLTNPSFLQASVERYGLSRYDQSFDFCHLRGEGKTGAIRGAGPNILLWRAFVAQVYDMHFANHLYDAGTIACSGVLEAELGKALIINPDPAIAGAKPKVYYIEGYEHSWSYPGSWTTTFTVSHGQFKVDQGEKIFIDAADNDFGQEDILINSAYLAKTQTKRGGG